MMVSRVTEARAHVLRSIRTGLPPGAPVSVKMTASELRISHTPVREALERLVGEGLLVSTPDRHGFATPLLTVREVAGLHLLYGTLLNGLVDHTAPVSGTMRPPDPADPIRAVEDAVAGTCRGGGACGMMAEAVRSVDLRLVSYRLVEPCVIPGWQRGLIDLRQALEAGRSSAKRSISAFTKVRTSLSEEIVAAVEDLHAGNTSNPLRI